MREGKWSVLSLDPSINDCGYAGWTSSTPKQYGILHPPRALKDWRLKAASVRDQVLSLVRIYDPLFVICESPEFVYQSEKYDSRKNPDGALKLAYLVGMLASSVHVAPALPRFFLEVAPGLWKGRAPKTATLARVNHKFGLALTDEKRDLDIADAIGVGEWFHLMANPHMLGDGLHSPCSKEKTTLLETALLTSGWKR